MNAVKHFDFSQMPMGEKAIFEIPGIGNKNASCLIKGGFTKAYQLLGQFLLCSKDEYIFSAWFLNNFPSVSQSDQYECIKALKDWCFNNL